MTLLPYAPAHETAWNRLVDNSKNGTFLFNRSFMDYHAHRFTDASVLFEQKGKVVAVFPANWNAEERIVCSHGGLTYGGLILSPEVTTVQVMQMCTLLCRHYAEEYGAHTLIYKPIPYIYSLRPAQEDLYALFRLGATLQARAISTAVPPRVPTAISKLRHRGIAKAARAGLHYEVTNAPDSPRLAEFWQLLEAVLHERHATRPVHTLEEMRLLMSRFPKEITLCYVHHEGVLVGGCLLFLTRTVAHAQYIAADERGRSMGALDYLFGLLVTKAPGECSYFDFGISTEQGGTVLNQGLIFQKEGFGGRGVCYDAYEVPLAGNAPWKALEAELNDNDE